MSSGVFSEVVW
jgi:hypothetical protein